MNQWQNFVNIIESNKEKRKEIVNALGYKDLMKGLNKFITQVRNKTLAEDRLEFIAPILNLNSNELISDYRETKEIAKKEQDLVNQITYLKQQISLRDNFKPYIYIETTLKRPSSITFAALLGGGMKYIREFPERILDLSKAEQIAIVKNIILEHYKKDEGNCLFFGRVTGYIYYPYFNNGMKFSVSGLITEENIPAISQSKFVLSCK